MKLEIYRRELNEYNMIGACGYVVNAKKPATAVRRFAKAVKESNKLNEAERERILEFVEDEKTFIETLDGETHVGETNEYILDLEEIEEGYWYISVSASVEKEKQEGETVETPSNEEEKEEQRKKENEMELRINKDADYEKSIYKDNEDIMRMINHAKRIVEEIENCDDIYDYFYESEVRYVIDSNKELLGGYLTIEFGGPTTIVDTYENVLCVYWGGDSAICELNSGTCEEINDYLEMLYTC